MQEETIKYEAYDLKEIVRPLLDWYAQNARVLPWRENTDPYRVWVSEIMLQQTRVEAVRAYFERFMQALPDIPALAAASEERLMKLWEGLGYYSRARNLQAAARQVMERFGGSLPADYDALRSLPGIGPYTAGAVASIAFGLPVPAVDGNVLRVLARLTASLEDIAEPKTRANAETALQKVMPPGETGEFTQALMELGAMICLPNGAPLCGECPLRGLCRAYREGLTDALPVKKKKAPRRIEQRTVLLVTDGKRLAVQKRGAKGLLAGMWELPALSGHVKKGEAENYVSGLGLRVVEIMALPSATHVFTHVEWHMKGWLVRVARAEEAEGIQWADRDGLRDRYAVPSAFRQFLKAFGEDKT